MSSSLGIVVADDPGMASFYQQALPALGHQVVVVHTGGQLVETCRRVRPDLVITEVRCADLDGIAAAGEICRDQPTPIILVSGDHDIGLVERVLDNPYVLACLLKPIKDVGLGPTIAVVMNCFQRLRSSAKGVADLRQAL